MVPLSKREEARKNILNCECPEPAKRVKFHAETGNIYSIFSSNFWPNKVEEGPIAYVDRIAKSFLWPDCLSDKNLVSAIHRYDSLEVAAYYMIKYSKKAMQFEFNFSS